MDKPVIFWDFHGTLSLPDVVWFDAALEAAAEHAPHRGLTMDLLVKHFSKTCLPWYTEKSLDTRHLTAPGAWWAHCQTHFANMFVNCGFLPGEAKSLAPLLREKVLQTWRYSLYPDAIFTLQELQNRAYTSYILSNNYPELPSIINGLGLSGLFKDVLVSGVLGFEKPRPEIFAAALEAAGSPKAAFMVGDNPVDDIDGANMAGFTTVAAHKNLANANYSIGSLNEILQILP